MNAASRLLKLRRTEFLNKLSLRKSSSSTKKLLFTPGPLLTSKKVKQSMMVDLGSRDIEFINVVKFIQTELLDVAGVGKPNQDYVTVLMQGSGTFGVESVIQTVTKRDRSSNFLILENGAYGKRMGTICKMLDVPHHIESYPEHRAIDLQKLEEFMKKGTKYTHVGVIHGETTSGVLNKVEDIGQLVKKYCPDSTYIVDSMSAFGACPVDLRNGKIDFLVSSSNKCIQSVPGFSFVICDKDKLLACKNNSRSLCLDLYDQFTNMQKTNQFRFTPPTHSLIAFRQALIELEEEGGPAKRYERYLNNAKIAREGFGSMGFRELVPPDEQSGIINTFYYPNDKNFVFEKFYELLSDQGKVIYPGKMSIAPCFRIGNIGELYADDMIDLVDCVKQVLKQMNVKIPVS